MQTNLPAILRQTIEGLRLDAIDLALLKARNETARKRINQVRKEILERKQRREKERNSK